MTRAWLVALAACGSSVHAPPPAPAQPCGDDGILIGTPAMAALACDDDRRHCEAKLPVTIRNCRAAPFEVRDLVPPAPCTHASFQPHTVRPDETWTFELSTGNEGAQDAVLDIRAEELRDGQHMIALRRQHTPTFVVTNPAAAAARAACRACNGEWAAHGMMRTRSMCNRPDDGMDCNCRTHDAGKPCADGDDCESWCERTRFDVVGTFNGVPVGYAKGACAEFVTPWSCTHPIRAGASKHPPAPFDNSETCID